MTYQYTHETEWVMPDSFPDLSDAQLIAIDLETYDPGLKETGAGWATGKGYIIGIAVAEGGASWYFPIRHANGGNLDARMALRWLADVCSNPDCTYVFHNAMYDIGWLRAEGGDEAVDGFRGAAVGDDGAREVVRDVGVHTVFGAAADEVFD